MADDPYREPAGSRCPRCRGVLVEGDGGDPCVTGCGEWLPHGKSPVPREAYDKRVDGAIWWTLGTGDGARCPSCSRPMMTYGTLYEYCGAHGAWVDVQQRNNFRAAFAAAFRRVEKPPTIAARAMSDRHTLIERVVRLEERVRELEDRLAAVERKR
jgi:hypothetical protein